MGPGLVLSWEVPQCALPSSPGESFKSRASSERAGARPMRIPCPGRFDDHEALWRAAPRAAAFSARCPSPTGLLPVSDNPVLLCRGWQKLGEEWSHPAAGWRQRCHGLHSTKSLVRPGISSLDARSCPGLLPAGRSLCLSWHSPCAWYGKRKDRRRLSLLARSGAPRWPWSRSRRDTVAVHIHSTQATRSTISPLLAMEVAQWVDRKRRWNIQPLQQRVAGRGIHKQLFIKEEEFYGGWK